MIKPSENTEIIEHRLKEIIPKLEWYGNSEIHVSAILDIESNRYNIEIYTDEIKPYDYSRGNVLYRTIRIKDEEYNIVLYDIHNSELVELAMSTYEEQRKIAELEMMKSTEKAKLNFLEYISTCR